MIAEAAAISGIVAVVVIGATSIAAYAARTWIGTHIQEGVRLGTRKELEDHRHDLRVEENALLEELRKLNTQLHAIQGTANSAFIEGQRVAVEWRIRAVNDLWTKMLRLRRATPSLVFYADILQPNQYSRPR